MRNLFAFLTLVWLTVSPAPARGDAPPVPSAARVEPPRIPVVLAVPVTREVVTPTGERRLVTTVVNVLHEVANPRARPR